MQKSNMPYVMSAMILIGGLSIQPSFDVVSSWYVLTTLAAFLLGFMQTRSINPRSIISLKAGISTLSFLIYAFQSIILEHGILVMLVGLITDDGSARQITAIVAGVLYLGIGISVWPIAKMELKKRYR